ncbi:Cuticlin-1 [Aphelenchoides besseyi]|nr:Cuticlin-1 [Aphelenchoides besseyi]
MADKKDRRFIVLILLCFLNAQVTTGFLTYSPQAQPNQYPAPPVPRGYQPPPDPPLASEYYLNGATGQNLPSKWSQFPQQEWNQRQNAWQTQQQTAVSNNRRPSFPVGLPTTQPPSREPVLINTVIQVFANENSPDEMFSETRTLTAVNGNDRVEISKNTTLDTHQGALLSQEPFSRRQHNPGNFARVRAFAATNNTHVTKEELEKELNRELESAIPFILDELDKAEETQTTTRTTTPNRNTQSDSTTTHTTNQPTKDVTPEDMEDLINSALSQIEEETRQNRTSPMPTTMAKVTETTIEVTAPTSTTLNQETPSSTLTRTTAAKTTTHTAAETTSIEVDLPTKSTRPLTTKTTQLSTTMTTESVREIETTPKLIVFERTTASSVTESEIPEAETTENEDVNWVTTIPSKPAFATEIVDLEPLQTSTVAEAQQQDLTVATSLVEQTVPNSERTTTQQNPITTVEITPAPSTVTEDNYSSTPNEVSSSPVLILTQQSETHVPSSTVSKSPGVTAELIVPDHAVHADSSESHPRTWKPKRPTTTTLQRITPSITSTTDKTTVDQTLLTSGTSTELSITTDDNINSTPTSSAQITTDSTPQTINEANDECPVPNDPKDEVRGDVLFLLDGSTVLGPEKFERAKKLIVDTVKQFRNIGPNGIQVSLIQFTGEPFLEFSFRAHDCITELLDDISTTQYATGSSNVGRAVEKVMKFAFTPTRLARKNLTTLLVIATVEARPNEVKSLASNVELDVFNLTDVAMRPLHVRLAERIRSVLNGKSNPLTTETEEQVSYTTIEPTIQKQPSEQVQTNVDPAVVSDNEDLASSLNEGPSDDLPASYQDNNVQIQCLNDGANFRIPESFAGLLAAKDFVNVSGCFVKIPQINRESTTIREISLVIRSNQCGLNALPSISPQGTNHSVVINLFHDKKLVTAEDRSYVIQCFVPQFEREQTLETRLDVDGFMAFSKTIELNAVPPGCNYTLRRDTPNGPILQTASIGQVIYHRWECGEVTYANDRILAHVRSFVFTFVDVESLLFSCKISLCQRAGDGCEGYSPPMCKSSNFSEMLLSRVRRHEAAFDAALTLDVKTQSVDLTDPLKTEKHIHLPTSTKWAILVFAVTVGVAVGLCCFLCVQPRTPPPTHISTMFEEELPSVSGEISKSHTSLRSSFLARNSAPINDGYLPMIMNLSVEEQECISEAFQYYDNAGDNKISISQIGSCLHSRITIEEFKPIYGALKKEDHPATYDQMVSCLGNFEREQEGYIMEADLRHVLENLGERLNSNETEGVLKHIEFVNGKARISEIADLLLGKNEL